jgi:flagellar hook-length control protein FliK
MTQIPSTLLDAPPPPARDPGRTPGDPPDAPFASVLEDQARTAVAEGRHRQTEREPGADAPAPIGEEADAPALVALLGGLPLPAGESPLDPAPSAPQPVAAPAAGVPAPTPSATGGPAIPTGPAVPAAASSLPLGPAAAQTASAATAVASAAPSTPAAPAGQQPPATGTAGGQQPPAGPARAEATPLAAPAAPTADDDAPASGRIAPAAAAIADRAAQQPGAPQPAATGQAPTAQATPPTAPSAPAASAPATQVAPPPAAHGVRLAEAVETVKLAFRAAAERGVAHARIALSPRELGGIEIQLKQTADGLLARVVAEHQAVAQLLHTAGAELRRSLEAQGLTLLQLDVGTPGDERGAAGSGLSGFADGAAGDGRKTGARSGADRADDGDELVLGAAADADPTTIALPNGALVDVLA